MSFYENVEGAPFHIGDRVTVLNNPNNDETFNMLFVFKTGVIVHFDSGCGCGQSFPDDPKIGVRFNNETIEEFWKEELSHSD